MTADRHLGNRLHGFVIRRADSFNSVMAGRRPGRCRGMPGSERAALQSQPGGPCGAMRETEPKPLACARRHPPAIPHAGTPPGIVQPPFRRDPDPLPRRREWRMPASPAEGRGRFRPCSAKHVERLSGHVTLSRVQPDRRFESRFSLTVRIAPSRAPAARFPCARGVTGSVPVATSRTMSIPKPAPMPSAFVNNAQARSSAVTGRDSPTSTRIAPRSPPRTSRRTCRVPRPAARSLSSSAGRSRLIAASTPSFDPTGQTWRSAKRAWRRCSRRRPTVMPVPAGGRPPCCRA